MGAQAFDKDQLKEAFAYIDAEIEAAHLANQLWLTAVDTKAELDAITPPEPDKTNYLCRVIADTTPSNNGVWQWIAGSGTWTFFSSNVDFIDDEELLAGIKANAVNNGVQFEATLTTVQDVADKIPDANNMLAAEYSHNTLDAKKPSNGILVARRVTATAVSLYCLSGEGCFRALSVTIGSTLLKDITWANLDWKRFFRGVNNSVDPVSGTVLTTDYSSTTGFKFIAPAVTQVFYYKGPAPQNSGVPYALGTTFTITRGDGKLYAWNGTQELGSGTIDTNALIFFDDGTVGVNQNKSVTYGNLTIRVLIETPVQSTGGGDLQSTLEAGKTYLFESVDGDENYKTEAQFSSDNDGSATHIASQFDQWNDVTQESTRHAFSADQSMFYYGREWHNQIGNGSTNVFMGEAYYVINIGTNESMNDGSLDQNYTLMAGGAYLFRYQYDWYNQNEGSGFTNSIDAYSDSFGVTFFMTQDDPNNNGFTQTKVWENSKGLAYTYYSQDATTHDDQSAAFGVYHYGSFGFRLHKEHTDSSYPYYDKTMHLEWSEDGLLWEDGLPGSTNPDLTDQFFRMTFNDQSFNSHIPKVDSSPAMKKAWKNYIGCPFKELDDTMQTAFSSIREASEYLSESVINSGVSNLDVNITPDYDNDMVGYPALVFSNVLLKGPYSIRLNFATESSPDPYLVQISNSSMTLMSLGNGRGAVGTRPYVIAFNSALLISQSNSKISTLEVRDNSFVRISGGTVDTINSFGSTVVLETSAVVEGTISTQGGGLLIIARNFTGTINLNGISGDTNILDLRANDAVGTLTFAPYKHDGIQVKRMRFQGKITAAANVVSNLQIMDNVFHILACGGTIQLGSDRKWMFPADLSGESEAPANANATVCIDANRIFLKSKSASARTGTTNNTYDIWVEYV
jgi:hypothetical protein